MTAGPGGSVTVRVQRRPQDFQAYSVQVFPRMSVLDALFVVQREQDRTLSFRYSCRLGMCGDLPGDRERPRGPGLPDPDREFCRRTRSPCARSTTCR